MHPTNIRMPSYFFFLAGGNSVAALAYLLVQELPRQRLTSLRVALRRRDAT